MEIVEIMSYIDKKYPSKSSKEKIELVGEFSLGLLRGMEEAQKNFADIKTILNNDKEYTEA